MFCAYLILQDLDASYQIALERGPDDPNQKLFVPDADEDIMEYRFEKFAATYFEGGHTPYFIRKPIQEPLLDLNNEYDREVLLSNSLVLSAYNVM